MMVINTNIQSMIAQRTLKWNEMGVNRSLERLSTGLRINRGKDDPAGLIASEKLRSEIRSIHSALTNAERADQFMNVVEGGMTEINNLLTDLQGLVTQSANEAGQSLAEREAAQLQVDSILQAINRISGTTSFQGTKVLNGTFDARASNVGAVDSWSVHSAKFAGDSLDVTALVTQSAQLGGLFLSMGGTVLDLSSGSAQFTLDIQGANGGREFTFASGTSIAAMRDAINGLKNTTGVSAMVVTSGTTTGLKLVSTDYGSSDFVSVKVIDHGGISSTDLGVYALQSTNFNALNTTRVSAYNASGAKSGVRDEGQNVQAIVNGQKANSDGRRVWLSPGSGNELDIEFTLNTTASTTLGKHAVLTLVPGGANFQIAPQVNLAGQANIVLPTLDANHLGLPGIGFLKDLATAGSANLVNGDLSKAQQIVNQATTTVTLERARIGAFQKYTLGGSIRILGIALENTTAAESIIRDTDFANETANLTRGQILVQAGVNVLALANSQPQQALALLG